MAEKKSKKKVYTVILVLILVIILIAIFYPSIIVNLGKTITGLAVTKPTSVSVSISGTNPVKIMVFNKSAIGGITPTANQSRNITFKVRVTDPDGRTDINDSSVKINLTYKGVGRRNNTACKKLTSEYNATSQNYSCSMWIWYWDTAAKWVINVSARDLGIQTLVENHTANFSWNQLQSFVIAPGSISWASLSPGATNQTAASYIRMNNTGNYNVSAGNIQVNATNLYNAAGTTYLGAGNFSSSAKTGAGNPECQRTGVLGTQLVNGTSTGIVLANLTAGNLSVAARAKENLYYCMWKVPTTLASGTYDTTNPKSYAWTIKII